MSYGGGSKNSEEEKRKEEELRRKLMRKPSRKISREGDYLGKAFEFDESD